MIVRPRERGIQLITQPDHAHLARAIMDSCVALREGARRDDILLAIQEHDNGWTEEDAAPTTDPLTGNVVDFVHAAVGVRHRVWPRGVARLASRPWAAALVAQHAITVYDRFRGDPEWTSFFDAMQSARDEMCHTAGGSLADVDADYPFVRLADLISLAFCAGWTDEQRFGEWKVTLIGDRVSVTPDPFGGAVIPIAIGMRTLAQDVFRSDAELRAAFNAAPVTMLRGEVAGG